ncbi:hypothetical protein C7M84_007065 [Penaeus vannamei]|uniref:Uncharacterized protein n=1 Tax=Penaeus vannamei TaxID=6689 RepID=A0A3R7M7U7_PENVA|nr:hypothetical protein C7M84_007065 [Penaeus vannamei]
MQTAPAKVTSLFVRQEICHSRGNFAPGLQPSPKYTPFPGDYCDRDCRDTPPKDTTWRRPRCVRGATCVHVFGRVLESSTSALPASSRLRSLPRSTDSPRSRLGLQGRAGRGRRTHDALLPLTYLRVTEATTRRERASGGEGDKLVSCVAAGPRDLPITTSGTTCAIVSVSSLAVSTCSTFATVAVVTSPPELGMCERSRVHVAALSDTGDDATVLRSRTTVLSRGSHSSDRPRPRSAQPPVAPHTRRRWEEPRATRAEPEKRAGLRSSSLPPKLALLWLIYVEQHPAHTTWSRREEPERRREESGAGHDTISSGHARLRDPRGDSSLSPPPLHTLHLCLLHAHTLHSQFLHLQPHEKDGRGRSCTRSRPALHWGLLARASAFILPPELRDATHPPHSPRPPHLSLTTPTLHLCLILRSCHFPASSPVPSQRSAHSHTACPSSFTATDTHSSQSAPSDFTTPQCL